MHVIGREIKCFFFQKNRQIKKIKVSFSAATGTKWKSIGWLGTSGVEFTLVGRGCVMV